MLFLLGVFNGKSDTKSNDISKVGAFDEKFPNLSTQPINNAVK
jgi:hypothetical protein